MEFDKIIWYKLMNSINHGRMARQMTTKYQESDIKVLKGLEPVKHRPGMYTRTENPLHIIQEVIDNASDEVLSGHGHEIRITHYLDGSVEVSDFGRGIPTGMHPEEGVSVIELVFTRLHAGGKFSKQDANSSYRFSGGLHGVGVSVTNALSQRLEVTVHRESKVHRIVFSNGDVLEPLSKVGPCEITKTGTSVRSWPNPKYFDNEQIPAKELRDTLRDKAMLLKGVAFVYRREISEGDFEDTTYQFQNGISQSLAESVEMSDTSLFFHLEKFSENITETGFEAGEGCEVAFCFHQDAPYCRRSFVNLIPTALGGTHESGLKEAVFGALKSFIEIHNLSQKGLRINSDDVSSSMSFILAAKLVDPQFQGQTKERLNNREAIKLVSWSVRSAFELWLSDHIEIGKRIAEIVLAAAARRQNNAKKIDKRKSSGVATLPGKLTDCETSNLDEREVFLVEGDSAGGSAKMGRNKENQAILPLRGKVLNAWETEMDRLFANREIHDISVAIGVDPHDSPEKGDLTGLRYSKICILSDADVDGSHIQVLLITLFFRHFPLLVKSGHVYVSLPPLFRIDTPASGKGRPARKIYCIDEDEKRIVFDRLIKEGVKETSIAVSRFKGLGEMSAEQLWETTLNPETRKMIQLTTDDFTGNTFVELNKLMAKNESNARRELLETFGDKYGSEE